MERDDVGAETSAVAVFSHMHRGHGHDGDHGYLRNRKCDECHSGIRKTPDYTEGLADRRSLGQGSTVQVLGGARKNEWVWTKSDEGVNCRETQENSSQNERPGQPPEAKLGCNTLSPVGKARTHHASERGAKNQRADGPATRFGRRKVGSCKSSNLIGALPNAKKEAAKQEERKPSMLGPRDRHDGAEKREEVTKLHPDTAPLAAHEPTERDCACRSAEGGHR